MIKKLQRKFILIAMIAIFTVTFSIFGMIAVYNYMTIDKQSEGLLNIIMENDGKMPPYKPRSDYMSNVITKESQFTTRYFYFKLDGSGSVTETNLDYIASLNEEEAMEVLEKVKDTQNETGYFNDYKYKILQKEDEKLIVFLDCHSQLSNFRTTTEKSIVIILIGLTVVFIIISVLSKKVLTPIIKNMESQKQFITNAGHELKTPVAVILANMDVLEMTDGEENEWIKSTKNQAKRLETLIKSLLNLAKVEEGDVKLEYSEFSITQIIKEEISEFKSLAQNKQMIFDDSKEIMMCADMSSITQLITILIDNAVKYTPDGGTIQIEAEKIGKNTKIQIMNHCDNLAFIDTSKLFERFYREDKARTQGKSGYGIGLSMAKSIVELHHGKIEANKTKNGMLSFTIVI